MRLRLACGLCRLVFFFFNDTATTEIYTLSLHDALPISIRVLVVDDEPPIRRFLRTSLAAQAYEDRDRKSTRLNSSHLVISYAVFCLKKKKQQPTRSTSDSPPQLRRLPPPHPAWTPTASL